VNDKIDILFSPERLRGKWSAPNPGVKQKTNRVSAEYLDVYTSVQKTIDSRFSGERCALLNGVMDQLKPLLDLRFPPPDKQHPSAEQIQTLNQSIDQGLALIEDLVEAFEIQDNPA
jgi:hypothetical protein